MQAFNLQKHQPSVAAAVHLLHELKIKICGSTVNETLQNHPDYPSLLSISDSLSKWKIDNAAIKTTAEKLPELPLPFIANLKTNGGSFVVVTSLTPTHITYSLGGG